MSLLVVRLTLAVFLRNAAEDSSEHSGMLNFTSTTSQTSSSWVSCYSETVTSFLIGLTLHTVVNSPARRILHSDLTYAPEQLKLFNTIVGIQHTKFLKFCNAHTLTVHEFADSGEELGTACVTTHLALHIISRISIRDPEDGQ